MDTKEHVRQRRNERIRELQERGTSANVNEFKQQKSSISISGDANRLPPMHRNDQTINRQEQRLLEVYPVSSEWHNEQERPIIDLEAGTNLIPYNNEQWGDPEYVWNEKIKREFGVNAGNRFRGFTTDRPPGTGEVPYLRKSGGGWRFPTMGKSLAFRTLVSIMLFGAVWGLFQIDQTWSVRSQELVKMALSKPFDYQVAAAWYSRTFSGVPSFLPTFDATDDTNSVKVNGTIAAHLFCSGRRYNIAAF